MDLDELEKLAKAATPGPWFADSGNWQVESHNELTYRHGVCTFTPADRDCCDGSTNPINPYDDAEYIAAVNPTTILSLIFRIRELEGALNEKSKH